MSKKLNRLLWLVLALPVPLLWYLAKVMHERPHPLTTWSERVEQFHFSKDGQSACPEFDTMVECYNISTGKKVSPSVLNVDTVQSRGPFYFKRTLQRNRIFYGVRSGKTKNAPDVMHNQALATFSPDGRFVTLGEDEEVSRWDFETAKFLWKTHLKQPQGSYRVVDDLSSDGNLCIVEEGQLRSDERKYLLMSCRNEKVVMRFPIHTTFGFAPDSRTFWAWGDNEIRFFDSGDAKLLWKEKAQSMFWGIEPSYTPDGRVGIPHANGFDFLDARTGKQTLHLDVPTLTQMEAWDFSPDGQQLWWSTPKHEIFWRDLD